RDHCVPRRVGTGLIIVHVDEGHRTRRTDDGVSVGFIAFRHLSLCAGVRDGGVERTLLVELAAGTFLRSGVASVVSVLLGGSVAVTVSVVAVAVSVIARSAGGENKSASGQNGRSAREFAQFHIAPHAIGASR